MGTHAGVKKRGRACIAAPSSVEIETGESYSAKGRAQQTEGRIRVVWRTESRVGPFARRFANVGTLVAHACASAPAMGAAFKRGGHSRLKVLKC